MVFPPRGHSYYNGRNSASARVVESSPESLASTVTETDPELNWGSPIGSVGSDSLSPEIVLADELGPPPTRNPLLRRSTELSRIASTTTAPLLRMSAISSPRSRRRRGSRSRSSSRGSRSSSRGSRSSSRGSRRSRRRRL